MFPPSIADEQIDTLLYLKYARFHAVPNQSGDHAERSDLWMTLWQSERTFQVFDGGGSRHANETGDGEFVGVPDPKHRARLRQSAGFRVR
jgi:hypothetical protein